MAHTVPKLTAHQTATWTITERPGDRYEYTVTWGHGSDVTLIGTGTEIGLVACQAAVARIVATWIMRDPRST